MTKASRVFDLADGSKVEAWYPPVGLAFYRRTMPDGTVFEGFAAEGAQLPGPPPVVVGGRPASCDADLGAGEPGGGGESGGKP